MKLNQTNTTIIQNSLVLFTVLTGCSNGGSQSLSSSEFNSSSLVVSSSKLSESPIESSSSSQNPNLYIPQEPEFRYLGQNWNLSILNQNIFPLASNQYFTQLPESGKVTVGMTDAIGFGENNHGGRMIRSINTYYPEVGIEALTYNGSLMNNPYYYDQEDYTKSGLYVDLIDQKSPLIFTPWRCS